MDKEEAFEKELEAQRAALEHEKRVLKEEIAERKDELGHVATQEKKVERELRHQDGHHRPASDDGGFALGASLGDMRGRLGDLKSVGRFLYKHRALLLILIPLLLSIYVRTSSMGLPIAESWAYNSVQTFIRSDISNVVRAQYPNLPDDNLNRLVDQQVASAVEAGRYTIQTGQYRGQTVDINNEIAVNAAQLREFWQYELDGKKYVYMPDIDPYFYLRYARDYLEHGFIGDEKDETGRVMDTHVRAPNGAPVSVANVGFLPIGIAWTHRLVSVFRPGIDLMQSGSLYPVLIIALAIIPAFLLGRRLAGNNVGGFFAAFMLALNVAALTRTNWGHPDTDGHNLLFPLLIVLLLVEAFRAMKLRNKLIYAGAAGLTTGLYSLGWTGWWYIFDFILGAFGVYAAWLILRSLSVHKLRALDPRVNVPWRSLLLVSILFIAVTGGVVSMLISPEVFIRTPLAALGFTNIKNAAHENLWPNVYTTVAELNPGSIGAAISAIGGNAMFTIALLGILGLLIADFWVGDRKHHITESSVFEAAVLIIWFIGTIYATTKGIRFTLLLAPAFSIAFGVALGLLYKLLVWGGQRIRIPQRITAATVIVVFLLLLWPMVGTARSVGYSDVPIMNDAWYGALTKIHDEASKDAIVNSWWDFGHYFTYITDRRVTFDGGSQNQPQAHWIGHVLLTGDEKQAIGILRMLDCGGNNGYNLVANTTDNRVDAYKTIYNALRLDKDAARKHYEKHGVPKAEIARLLKLTHCDAPEDYFITSDDMIGKAGVWGHFGSWNLQRAYAYTKHKGSERETAVADLMSVLNWSRDEAETIYDDVQSLSSEDEANAWIAPWPNYITGPAGCGLADGVIACGNGIQFNTTNGETLVAIQGRVGRPQSIVYLDGNGTFVEKRYNDSIGDVSVAIAPEGNGYIGIMMAPSLAKSMFTRLYFFQGHGLEYFKHFDTRRHLSGGYIFTWKVDWDGGEPNTPFTPEPVVQKVEEPSSGQNETLRNVTNTTTAEVSNASA